MVSKTNGIKKHYPDKINKRPKSIRPHKLNNILFYDQDGVLCNHAISDTYLYIPMSTTDKYVMAVLKSKEPYRADGKNR